MKSPASKLSRRNFLFAAGAGGAAAVAAVVNEKSPQAISGKTRAASGSTGYHVTDHIRKYYDTAKV